MGGHIGVIYLKKDLVKVFLLEVAVFVLGWHPYQSTFARCCVFSPTAFRLPILSTILQNR
jgi:hypothetical protein